MRQAIEALSRGETISEEALLALLSSNDPEIDAFLFATADQVRHHFLGDEVQKRCLVEFTNYCRNNCYYCGIRHANQNVKRYRLTPDEILHCCQNGYENGLRTFVLQGGEDDAFDDDTLCAIVEALHAKFPDCIITLSVGERSKESYQRLFQAGARRYLLRHETADFSHYHRLHPPEMSPENRQRCLFEMKEIGYQVGAGMLVGSPFQTPQNLLCDFRFLKELQPFMIGIGPFLPHHDTPFSSFPPGDVTQTLRVVALARLLFPKAMIPATTALEKSVRYGKDAALHAGANVVMYKMIPKQLQSQYTLYDALVEEAEG